MSNGIMTALRSAKMPTTKRKKPPSIPAMRECAKVCRDLGDAADWFHVERSVFDDWLRTKSELAREWRRAKLEDVREMRLIFREKAVAGSIQAVEKYLRMSYPDSFGDKPQQLNITTEVRVLPPPPDKPQLIIEGESTHVPKEKKIADTIKMLQPREKIDARRN